MPANITEERQGKIYGYIHVSTIDQDTEKNKADILFFSNARGFLGQVTFVEEKVSGLKSWKTRKLKDLVDTMQEGDVLIIPELSRLGRSLIEVLEVLSILSNKGVRVFSVKENFLLNDNDDIYSKVLRTMLALFAEIERDLISARTKEALATVRASGKKLGRPKGPGKSKLDPHREEVIALIRNGSTKKFIAERYGVTPASLTNWLRKHGLDKIKSTP